MRSSAALPAGMILLLACGPSLAGEPAPGSTVEMPYVIAPLNDSGGKLTAYAYISAKTVATSPDAAVDVRSKLAFIQDLDVRDVNSKPVGTDGSPIDKTALTARFLANARKVVGSKAVAVRITQIQIAPLRGAPQG